MKGKLLKQMTFALCLATFGSLALRAMASGAVPRITKEELKVLIDYIHVTILDVRTGRDWKSGKFKVKGAFREDPAAFKSWADQYPKDGTMILYCA